MLKENSQDNKPVYLGIHHTINSMEFGPGKMELPQILLDGVAELPNMAQ